MWNDLRMAARDGVLLGVKWACAFGMIAFALSWIVRDYDQVRQRALNGQRAYEAIVRLQDASNASSK